MFFLMGGMVWVFDICKKVDLVIGKVIFVYWNDYMFFLIVKFCKFDFDVILR